VAVIGSVAWCSAAAQVKIPEQLESFQLDWQPWKVWNWTVPNSIGYCSQQHCLRCSEPVEWETHPYQTCTSAWGGIPDTANASTTSTTAYVHIDLASSLYPFDSLLVCFAAEGARLSLVNTEVLLVKEGGELYNSEGETLHPPPDPLKPPFFEGISTLQGTTIDKDGPLFVDAIEFGTISDFLGNDPYYADNLRYMRYDNFFAHPETKPHAKRLIRPSPSEANCMLLTSQSWKTRTRYELGIGVNVTADTPVWVAPLKAEVSDGTLLPGQDRRMVLPEGGEAWLTLSVRGPKTGSVCAPPPPQEPAEACAGRYGHVWTPRGGGGASSAPCSTTSSSVPSAIRQPRCPPPRATTRQGGS